MRVGHRPPPHQEIPATVRSDALRARNEVTMASTIQELKLAGFATWTTAEQSQNYEKVYQQNRHRVYALAFWMTDNEMSAEELMGNVFRRAFALHADPSEEAVDRALIVEFREIAPLGSLPLASPAA